MSLILRQIVEEPRSQRILIAFAAVLGVLAGEIYAHATVAACSCSEPMWQLQLDRTTEQDDSIWPERALLTAYPPPTPVSFRSYSRDAKIDYILGGSW